MAKHCLAEQKHHFGRKFAAGISSRDYFVIPLRCTSSNQDRWRDECTDIVLWGTFGVEDGSRSGEHCGRGRERHEELIKFRFIISQDNLEWSTSCPGSVQFITMLRCIYRNKGALVFVGDGGWRVVLEWVQILFQFLFVKGFEPCKKKFLSI